jgi:hypothetical protein
MRQLFLCILLIISWALDAQSQPVKINARVRDLTQEEVAAEQEKTDNPLWLQKLAFVDPLWMARGTLFFGYEQGIGKYLSARINIGPTFRDYADGLLVEGPLELNYSVSEITPTPSISTGLEGRYYHDENGNFDSPYTGIGVAVRNYHYTGVMTNGPINNPDYRIPVRIHSRAFDLYARYGSFAQLYASGKTLLLLEYGLSIGFSVTQFDVVNPSQLTFPGPTVAESERNLAVGYFFLPHLGLGVAF